MKMNVPKHLYPKGVCCNNLHFVAVGDGDIVYIIPLSSVTTHAWKYL
jgi:hypothetical protein